MGVRRPKDGGVKRAGVNAEIVDETSTACQQSAIFHAFD
jgi:hypothetical protein